MSCIRSGDIYSRRGNNVIENGDSSLTGVRLRKRFDIECQCNAAEYSFF